MIEVTGPEHNQKFYDEVNKLNINISGSGRSKRLAEQNLLKGFDVIKKMNKEFKLGKVSILGEPNSENLLINKIIRKRLA